nr:hypothetical protein [Tanacetum cinerariifolium]
MLDQHRKEMHEKLSQIFFTIEKSKTPEPEAPNFAITTRYGVSTRDPPFPASSKSTPDNHADRKCLKGPHEAKECKQNNTAEQVCLFGGDIYDDPYLLRSKFEDELIKLMLEKKFHTKGIGEMLDQHRKEMHEKLSQIFFTIEKSETPEPEASNFAITTRYGVSTRDPPFPASSQSTPDNHADRKCLKV